MNLWRLRIGATGWKTNLVLVLGVGKAPCHFVSLLISGSRQSRRERTEMLRGTITIYKIMIRLQAGRASSDLGWWSTLAGEERITRHTVTGISSSHQYKLITTTKLPVKYWTSQENDIIFSLTFCLLFEKQVWWLVRGDSEAVPMSCEVAGPLNWVKIGYQTITLARPEY